MEAVVELPCSVAYCVPTAACHRCRSRASLASTLTECKFCDRKPGAFSDSTQLERVPPPALLHACCRMGFQQPIPTGGRSWSTCSHGLSTLLHSDRLCYIVKATAAYHRQGMHIIGYAHKASHNNYRPTLTNNTNKASTGTPTRPLHGARPGNRAVINCPELTHVQVVNPTLTNTA